MHPNSGMPVVAGRKIFVFHGEIIPKVTLPGLWFFDPYKADGTFSDWLKPLTPAPQLSLAKIFLINGIQWRPNGMVMVKWQQLEPASHFQINPIIPFIVKNSIDPKSWDVEFRRQCDAAVDRYEKWKAVAT